MLSQCTMFFGEVSSENGSWVQMCKFFSWAVGSTIYGTDHRWWELIIHLNPVLQITPAKTLGQFFPRNVPMIASNEMLRLQGNLTAMENPAAGTRPPPAAPGARPGPACALYLRQATAPGMQWPRCSSVPCLFMSNCRVFLCWTILESSENLCYNVYGGIPSKNSCFLNWMTEADSQP